MGRGDWCRLSFNLEKGKRKGPRGGTGWKNTVTSKPFPRPVQFYTASLLGVESHPALAKFMLQKYFFWRMERVYIEWLTAEQAGIGCNMDSGKWKPWWRAGILPGWIRAAALSLSVVSHPCTVVLHACCTLMWFVSETTEETWIWWGRLLLLTSNVSCLFLIYSGSRLGSIHHHDVRVAQHHIGTLCQNKQSICSLKWSLTNQLLASGSNDGMLNIWPSDPGVKVQSQPLKTIPHSSAVKVYGGGTSSFLYLISWNYVVDVNSYGFFQIISVSLDFC